MLAEFLHVVTDPRRFAKPLDMTLAHRIASEWWLAYEVERIYPDEQSTRLFLRWLEEHRLGRKRLLDTQLAATHRQAGVTSLLTTNPADFQIFGEFTCLTPTTA